MTVRRPPTNIGLDGLVGEIDPDLADAGSIQIVHVHLNRLRPLHFEQEVEVIVDLDLSRAPDEPPSAATRCHGPNSHSR